MDVFQPFAAAADHAVNQCRTLHCSAYDGSRSAGVIQRFVFRPVFETLCAAGGCKVVGVFLEKCLTVFSRFEVRHVLDGRQHVSAPLG
jgi:hypothetical protein